MYRNRYQQIPSFQLHMAAMLAYLADTIFSKALITRLGFIEGNLGIDPDVYIDSQTEHLND